MRDGVPEVGTAEHAACLGDPGGPVLVAREGLRTLAAVIHGSSGAICASGADAAPVYAHRGWISEVAGLAPPRTSHTAATCFALALAMGVGVAWLRRRRRS